MTVLLNDIRDTLASLIDQIDTALSAPVDPEPAPEYIGIPFTANLFGPVQGNGALVTTLPTVPTWLGESMTASSKYLKFSLNFPKVLSARVVVVWTPTSTSQALRFVHFSNGPTDIQDIATVYAPDGLGQPRASGADVTAAIQALVDGKVDRHIGFQGFGGGSISISEVRLEIVWGLPTA